MGVNWPTNATVLGQVSVTNPVDLAVSSSGNIYVLNSSQHQVLVFNSSLVLQNTITISATNPKGIALDSSGKIYIADTGGNRILRYTSAGVLDTTFDSDGIVGAPGTGDGQFNQPWAIAIDWSGYVYVTDSGNDRIQVFGSDGAFVRRWSQSGNGNGQLDEPSGFCLLGTSKVFVAEAANHRVQELSTYGYFFSKIGSQGSGASQFNGPRDVCYDLDFDQIIVTDTGNNRIQIFQLNNFGEWLFTEPKFVMEISDGYFSSLLGVACATNGGNQIIYVADTGNNRVVKLQVKQDKPGASPLHVFEMFKAAIRNSDTNRAVTFFAETSRSNYADIFQIIQPHFQDYVSGMGQMTLSSQISGTVKYEMLHQAGGQTFSFPVTFVRDEMGNWKISSF
jgi:DNA-binding beta-propeller fold protein YncE